MSVVLIGRRHPAQPPAGRRQPFHLRRAWVCPESAVSWYVPEARAFCAPRCPPIGGPIRLFRRLFALSALEVSMTVRWSQSGPATTKTGAPSFEMVRPSWKITSPNLMISASSADQEEVRRSGSPLFGGFEFEIGWYRRLYSLVRSYVTISLIFLNLISWFYWFIFDCAFIRKEFHTYDHSQLVSTAGRYLHQSH